MGDVPERCAASMAGHYENCGGQIEKFLGAKREDYSKKGEGEGRRGGDRGEEGTYQLEIGGTTLLGGGWDGKELELGGGIILL